MAEATIATPGGRDDVRLTAGAAVAAGEVWQMPDGRAAYKTGSSAAASGAAAGFTTAGQVNLPKSTGWVGINGQEVYWDHSANAVTFYSQADRDFPVGCLVGDAATGDTSCTVNLNVKPACIVDLVSSPFRHVPVLTAGTPLARMVGGSLLAAFSETAEAQKLDLLSVRSWPVSANWVLEAVVSVVANCDADVGDLNVGVASATDAADFDAIAEFAAFHWDLGADLDLDAQSDDGTTDVAITDTTINWAVGTPVHLMIDGRTHTDIQFYVNGVLVLDGTTFTLAAATGPLKAIFHLEKSSDNSPGIVELQRLRVRLAEQN